MPAATPSNMLETYHTRQASQRQASQGMNSRRSSQPPTHLRAARAEIFQPYPRFVNEHCDALDLRPSNRGARSNSSRGTTRRSGLLPRPQQPPPLHTKQFKVPKGPAEFHHRSSGNILAPASALGAFKSAKVTKRQKSLTRRSSAQQIPTAKKPGLDLGLPKIEDISYMNLKAQQLLGKNHDDCLKQTPDGQSKAYLELQRKVAKLEAEKKKQAQTIRQLQGQLAGNAANGSCCCDELRVIHNEKEAKLVKIGDAWKQKTYTLANQYFRSLQSVREENQQLRLQTYDAVDKLREYQHQVIEQILRKQEEMVLNYEKRLKKREKENKQLNKRVVQHRQNMVSKRLATTTTTQSDR